MFVVIGAGPAGLSAAWGLVEARHDVLVLEASEHVGGMAGSRTVAGIRVDLGSHRLHPSTSPALLARLQTLVDLQERPRRGRIHVAGRWIPFPLSPLGLLRLPAGVAARGALDVATARLRRPAADTYADVVRAGLGPMAWRHVHEPLARKLWDTDPTLLAGDLARRRVTAAAPGELPRRILAAARHRPTHWYPRGGFGAIAEAIAERVPVETGRRVVRLIEHGDRVIVGLADGRVVTASHVLSTVPAMRTAAWLGLVDDAALPLPMRALVLVYLVLDRRPYTTADAHYLPDRTVLPSRISEPTNYRDDPADPADRTVLCAEIPCWAGDEVWRADPAALAQRVADDLVRVGLRDPRPIDVHVERLPAAYPVCTQDALRRLEVAEAAMARSSRVTVLGRAGLFTPDDSHRVLEMGFAAAACARSDGSLDSEAWARARAGFRSFVVDD